MKRSRFLVSLALSHLKHVLYTVSPDTQCFTAHEKGILSLVNLNWQLQLLIGCFLGHVIPKEHLTVVALDKGPSGLQLDFTYQTRDSPQLVRGNPLNRHSPFGHKVVCGGGCRTTSSRSSNLCAGWHICKVRFVTTTFCGHFSLSLQFVKFVVDPILNTRSIKYYRHLFDIEHK